MTSLAHQLRKLALPQNDPNLLTRKEVASLLFDPKDASTMDRSTFYALGCNGLEALLGIEPKFLDFQDTLFSPSSMTLERSVQSREVNAKLDAGISLFLCRLSPYFLLRPAQKCIEWLIHRFHIQLYNVDSLLACALPYHETKVFVRVVQLLDLKEPTNRWNWLQCLQKPGVPLAKGTLITHCHKDLGFLDFICSMVTNSVKAYAGTSGNCSQLSVMFSFYASTVVLALDTVERVTDNIIAKLLPYIQKGLSSPLTDHKAATYMLVCQLAVKVVLEPGLVDTLALQLCKALLREPVLGREGLGCLIVLLQNQKEGAVGPKAFRRLSSMSSLVDTLQSMAAVHDVSPLLRYMVPHLVHEVLTTTDETESESPSPSRMFESLLQAVPLTKDLDNTVARLLLEEYMAQGQRSPESIPALNQRLLPLMRLFESKYSGAMDGVLTSYVSDGFNAEQKQLLHQFISLTMSGGKHQILGSDTSLLLSLSHPLPSVRTLAVEHLVNAITSGQRDSLDEAFVTEVLLDRMKDDVPEVVAAALKALELYLDHLDPEKTVSCLLSVLQKTELSLAGQWLPVLQEAVRVLCDPRLGLGSPDLRLHLGWKLLPFLVITSSQPESPEVQLASYVARSAAIAQHPLTLDWAKELEEVLKRSSERDFLGSANQQLVSTLTEKLASMDHISKRDALDHLAQVVEEQRGSGPRARAAWLVLTQALLQGLGGALSHTLHLLTAQRVYAMLERPLVELSGLRGGDDSAAQVSEEEVAPASFSEAMAAYLQAAGAKGKSADGTYGAVLLSLLRGFISSLSCDDKSFTAEVWWNPEKMDSNACCYLRLLCNVFELLLRGASGGRAAPSFRQLMKLFFQVHLKEPASVFKFLCVLWGYGANQGDQLELRVSAVLQTQALYVGRALLGAQPANTLEELASVNSPVVHSLLGCLCSPTREVRESAVGCLQSLSGAAASPFQPIIERLLKNTEEIVADPSHLSQILGLLHEECVSGKLKGAQRERLASSMEQLIQSIQAHDCPSYSASTLLPTLELVHGESVLAAMLPVLERLLEQSSPERPTLLRDKAQLMCLVLGKFSEASAPLLAKDQACLELFIRALRTTAQPYPDIPSCQIQALEQITKPFFSALGEEKVQQRLLGVMFDLLTESRTPAVSNTISSVFKGIAVDGRLVANELSPPEKPKVTVTIQQTRRSKLLQRKAADSGDSLPEEGAVSWQRVTLILELLQHKKKLKRPHLLVPPLFTLLSRSLEPCTSEHSNTEYTRQLLLSCLLNICQKVSPDGGPIAADVLHEDQFNVELVVQCVRVSEMPQTHHHALLLLGAGAGMFPEKVLHNIMPIFTFMGAGIMRLDDAYSFQVITRTVQTVIPALIKAHEGGSESSAHMEAVVAKMLHVFTDALPHVPEHRRLPIMAELVGTLGAARFLWVLLLLLFKQHATQTAAAASEKDAALERDVEFWISLCCESSVSDQLTALIQVLHYLMQLPQDKDHAPVKAAAGRRGAQTKVEESLEELIFSPEAHSSKELRHFKFLSVSFMAQLLSSASFIEKVADDGDVVEESLQQLQQSLLEEILRYIHSVARCVEENADKPTAKFWRALLTKAYDVLDKVNALLPTDTFIPVIRGLMGNELPSVRRKAMDLLNNKLQHRTRWEEKQVTVLLQLTGDLLGIVGKGRGKAAAEKSSPTSEEDREREDQAVNRQTALYSLKLLCRNFGAEHPAAFVPVLGRAVALVAGAQDEEKNVLGSALLCVAEAVGTLKALAIPQLPKLMPAVLQTLKDREDLVSSEIYLLSAVTALQRLVETLPHFISPYLHKTTLQVCRLTHLSESTTSSSSTSTQLSARLASLRDTLASKVPPRVLLPTLTRCYSDLVANKQDHLGPLMRVLKDHIAHMDKEQLSANQSELTSFFLTALDFRAKHCQGDLDKTQEVEGNVIDCLIAMVMKLSEVTFRPLFFKLFDWSKTETGGKERLLTFYRLADCIAERLKGLFVLFAGNLVKSFSDLLRQTNVAKTDEAFFDSEDDDGVKKTTMLLQYVLDCMFKIFLYDTQRFLSKERGETLLGPLVDQLENTLGGDEAYQSRVSAHLLPCIGQFAVAMGDDSQWKPLNYQILLKTRHDSAKVRFSSLLALMELTSKLRENYNVLLPETIPFLAELMEDESMEVEQQVQKVLQEMETILGEPMQQYF